MPLENNKYPTGCCECNEKPETMDDLLNEIIGLSLQNKTIINDIDNSLRGRGDEDEPKDGKVPELSKFEKLEVIRRLLRNNNDVADNIRRALD